MLIPHFDRLTAATLAEMLSLIIVNPLLNVFELECFRVNEDVPMQVLWNTHPFVNA